MKLRVVLWYMARRMEVLSRTNSEFIARLHGRDFILQISTEEGAHRYFHAHHNRIQSRGEVHAAPALTLLFKTDDIAFRLLSTADANAFMAAMQAGEVKLTGDYALLMWFMSVGKYLKPQGLKRRRPKGEAARHVG
ncbi:MAG: hypothetical protein ACRERR_08830 [Moraxellaceae bacterium]